MEEIEKQLQEARETNRRLHRRCQVTEALLERSPKQADGWIKEMEHALFRVRRYAAEWRSYARELRRLLREINGDEAYLREQNVKLQARIEQLCKHGKFL